MFKVFELFKRNGWETRLITPEPSLKFTYQAALIWNFAREVLQLDDFSKSSPKTAQKNKKISGKQENLSFII